MDKKHIKYTKNELNEAIKRMVNTECIIFSSEIPEKLEKALSINRFIKEMENCRELSNDDEELAHMQADQLMMDLLEDLGYGDGIKIFKEMHKWYA